MAASVSNAATQALSLRMHESCSSSGLPIKAFLLGTGQRLEDYKKLLLELNNQVVAQALEDLVIFPWKENIPLNRPPARCRENPALSGGLDSLCHIGTKINRPLWQR